MANLTTSKRSQSVIEERKTAYKRRNIATLSSAVVLIALSLKSLEVLQTATAPLKTFLAPVHRLWKSSRNIVKVHLTLRLCESSVLAFANEATFDSRGSLEVIFSRTSASDALHVPRAGAHKS